MTLTEWSECRNSQIMLDFLASGGLVDEREIRHFSCKCSRRVWHLLSEEPSRTAVVTAERYVEEAVSQTQLAEAFRLACEVVDRLEREQSSDLAILAAARASASAAGPVPRLYTATFDAAQAAAFAGMPKQTNRQFPVSSEAVWSSTLDAELAAQADLLRTMVTPVLPVITS